MIDCMVNPADLFLGIEPVAAPSAAGGGGGGVDLDALLSTANLYLNPDDADSLTLGDGGVVTFVGNKGTLEAKLKPSVARVLETIGGRQFMRFGVAAAEEATVRNLADSANVNAGDIQPLTGSTAFYVAWFGSVQNGHGTVQGDSGGWWRTLISSTRIRADYWDSSYKSAIDTVDAELERTYIIGVRHDGAGGTGKLSLWVDRRGKVHEVNVGNIGGGSTSAYKLPRSGVLLRMGVCAVYGSVLDDEQMAERMGALADYYSVE